MTLPVGWLVMCGPSENSFSPGLRMAKCVDFDGENFSSDQKSYLASFDLVYAGL
jgi:hypothetical protein